MGNQASTNKGEIKKINPTELQTYIMVVQAKLTQNRNKKVEIIKRKRKEVISSLEDNNLDIAKAKMESVLREEDYITVFDILGPLCEILKEKVSYLLLSNKVPDDIRATLDTVIYASTRLEIDELHKIREIIKLKYGELYVSKANTNADSLVNVNVVDKLKIKPATDQYLIARIKQLCREENINYEFPQDVVPMVNSFEPFNNFDNQYSGNNNNFNNQFNNPYNNNQFSNYPNPNNFNNYPNPNNFNNNNFNNHNPGNEQNMQTSQSQFQNVQNEDLNQNKYQSQFQNRYQSQFQNQSQNQNQNQNFGASGNNFSSSSNMNMSSHMNNYNNNENINQFSNSQNFNNYNNNNSQMNNQGGGGGFPTQSVVMNRGNNFNSGENNEMSRTGATTKPMEKIEELGASYNDDSPKISKNIQMTPKPEVTNSVNLSTNNQYQTSDKNNMNPNMNMNNNNESGFNIINSSQRSSYNPYQDDFNNNNRQSYNEGDGNQRMGGSVHNKLYSNEENATPKPNDEYVQNEDVSKSHQYNNNNPNNEPMLFPKTAGVFPMRSTYKLDNQGEDMSFPQINHSTMNQGGNVQHADGIDDFPNPHRSLGNDFPKPKDY